MSVRGLEPLTKAPLLTLPHEDSKSNLSSPARELPKLSSSRLAPISPDAGLSLSARKLAPLGGKSPLLSSQAGNLSEGEERHHHHKQHKKHRTKHKRHGNNEYASLDEQDNSRGIDEKQPVPPSYSLEDGQDEQQPTPPLVLNSAPSQQNGGENAEGQGHGEPEMGRNLLDVLNENDKKNSNITISTPTITRTQRTRESHHERVFSRDVDLLGGKISPSNAKSPASARAAASAAASPANSHVLRVNDVKESQRPTQLTTRQHQQQHQQQQQRVSLNQGHHSQAPQNQGMYARGGHPQQQQQQQQQQQSNSGGGTPFFRQFVQSHMYGHQIRCGACMNVILVMPGMGKRIRCPVCRTVINNPIQPHPMQYQHPHSQHYSLQSQRHGPDGQTYHTREQNMQNNVLRLMQHHPSSGHHQQPQQPNRR